MYILLLPNFFHFFFSFYNASTLISLQIFDEKGMLNRFDKNTQAFLREIDKVNKRKCKIFMCLAIMKTLLHEADKYLGNEFAIKDNTGLLNLLQSEPTNGYCKRDKEKVIGVVFYDLAGGNSTAHKTPNVDHESHYETNVGGEAVSDLQRADSAKDANGTSTEHSGYAIVTAGNHKSDKSSDETSSGSKSSSSKDVTSHEQKPIHTDESKNNEKDEAKVDHEMHFESAVSNGANKGEYKLKTNETELSLSNGEYDVGGGNELKANESELLSIGGTGEYDVGGSTIDSAATTPFPSVIVMQNVPTHHTDSNNSNNHSSSSGSTYEETSKDEDKQIASDGIDQYLEEHRATEENEGKLDLNSNNSVFRFLITVLA